LHGSPQLGIQTWVRGHWAGTLILVCFTNRLRRRIPGVCLWRGAHRSRLVNGQDLLRRLYFKLFERHGEYFGDFRALNKGPAFQLISNHLQGIELVGDARPWQGAPDFGGTLNLQGQDAHSLTGHLLAPGS